MAGLQIKKLSEQIVNLIRVSPSLLCCFKNWRKAEASDMSPFSEGLQKFIRTSRSGELAFRHGNHLTINKVM